MSNILNLQEINQQTALVLAKFSIDAGNNIFLFGNSGTGKSAIAMQAIKECNYKINYINLSVIERNDLCGYPDLHSNSPTIDFKLPNYLPPLDGKADQVILFDEVDKASPEVLAPLLELLQFKKINGISINVASCILTGNLPSERVYANQISSALLDRGSKYLLEFNFSQWLNWAKLNNVHDLILGFLQSNPDFVCGKDDNNLYASPSPRGWTYASNALIKANSLNIFEIETITQIISGYVGSNAGLHFRMWYEYYRKFEPFIKSLIERGSMAFNFDELVPTEKLIFVISTCFSAKQKVISDKSKKKFVYLERLCDFFNKYKVEKEMQVIGLHNSFSFDQITTLKLYECKVFFDHFTKLSENISFKK